MKKIITIILVLSIPLIVFADIYKWTDEQGIIHFSDTPVEFSDNAKQVQGNNNPQRKPHTSKIPIRPSAGYYNTSPTSYNQITEYWKDPETGISYKIPLNEYQIKKDRQRIKEQKMQIEAAKTAAVIFFLAIILSGIIYFALWLWAFLDILKNQFAGNDKLIWWLTITMIPILGLIAYATIGKNQKIIIDEFE